MSAQKYISSPFGASCLACLILCSFALAAGSNRLMAESAHDRLFTLKVKPILSEKCFPCHGDDPEEIEGGLILHTLEDMLLGGDGFDDVLVPGDAEASFMMTAVQWKDPDYEMPPKENDRLTQEEIMTLRDWIDVGAPWPDEETQMAIKSAEADRLVTDDGLIVKTSGGLSDVWNLRRYKPENLWAYKAINTTTPSFSGHPVDYFIDAELQSKGVDSAPQADPGILIRRVTFDLIGIPPSPEEIEQFMREWDRDSESAYANLVDRLLASPHYGERQAQYWLDVTRYADTSGGSNDFERSGVWRYRDYVVRSFNSDKPYDRFILEQIAGDELKPDDAEGAIAVGFLRMGPWEKTNMTVAALVRQQFLDDVVNHVGETFLAQPLRCAKCHDHKFDPVPTRDYYSFMAVFEEMNQAEVAAPFLPGEVIPDGAAERERIERELNRVKTEMDKLNRVRFDALVDWLVERGYDDFQFEFQGSEDKNPSKVIEKDFSEDKRPPKNYGFTVDQITYASVLNDRRNHFTRYLERFEPVAFTVYTGPPNDYFSSNQRNPIPTESTGLDNEPIHILSGGELDAPGERVYPGVISCVETLAGHRFEFTADSASPRIALARWIADPRNPLTARVIVNRIWQQHFAGKGLVSTPNNFGYTGGNPSHPELLDYLANWFLENGWSLKKLHRFIVSSKVYRRSARHPHPDSLSIADPNGILLAAYPVRRLHAEEMRDAMLAISGELNPKLGGTPVFPEINLEAAMQPRYLQVGVGPAYQPSPEPEDRHRRSLYAFRMRGLSNPFFEVFNKPSSDLSCERRDSTTVTPQVFSLLNGQQPHDRSLALAKRLEAYSKDGRKRITHAYELVYGRSASEAEIHRALEFVKKQTGEQKKNPIMPVSYPATVERSMVHEQTGIKSSWSEYLDVYDRTFVPDLKPWDVGPETRALAGFCLVLFNSNEFLYVE